MKIFTLAFLLMIGLVNKDGTREVLLTYRNIVTVNLTTWNEQKQLKSVEENSRKFS